jgi:hypothetical protein
MGFSNGFNEIREFREESTFDEVLRYYLGQYDSNLKKQLKDGVLQEWKPELVTIENGRTELESQKPVHSFFIMPDGTLVDKLIGQGVVKEEDLRDVVHVPTQDDFLGYLLKNKNMDGGYFFDRKNRNIKGVNEILPLTSQGIESAQDLLRLFPDECFYINNGREFPSEYKCKKINPADEKSLNKFKLDHIGTKTRNVARFSRVFGLPTTELRSTPYGGVGLPPLYEFNKHGMSRMFYFHHEPGLIFSPHLPVFIDTDNGNVGVHRTFAPDKNDVLRCTGTQYLVTDPTTSLNERKADLMHSKLVYLPVETCEQRVQKYAF